MGSTRFYFQDMHFRKISAAEPIETNIPSSDLCCCCCVALALDAFVLASSFGPVRRALYCQGQGRCRQGVSFVGFPRFASSFPPSSCFGRMHSQPSLATDSPKSFGQGKRGLYESAWQILQLRSSRRLGGCLSPWRLEAPWRPSVREPW